MDEWQRYDIIIYMWIADIVIAVAPVMGYLSQLHLIRSTKSTGSFSIDICAILMISGILRIYFWLEVGYQINLLFQAMLIIIVQVNVVVLRLSCSMRLWSSPHGPRMKGIPSPFGGGTPLISTVLVP
jgi:uncharacterized protein with PQ loop repeat